MDELQASLQQHYPDAVFEANPQFKVPSYVKNYTKVPSDYLQWMKEIGSVRLGDQFELFETLYPAEHIIADAQRSGVDNVLIFGKFAHGHVGFTTAFETWYVVVIVGEMNLCTAPKPKLSFRGYLEMFAEPRSEGADDDNALWHRVSKWNMGYVLIASILMLGAIVWGLYLLA